MAKAVTPKKPGRMKGAGKKKSDIEQMQDAAGQSAAASEGAPGPDSPVANGDGQPGRELGLEVPTMPVEVPAETREEEAAAAAAATAAKGQPGLTVNIAKLQAMTMTDLNSMAKSMGIENFGTMR